MNPCDPSPRRKPGGQTGDSLPAMRAPAFVWVATAGAPHPLRGVNNAAGRGRIQLRASAFSAASPGRSSTRGGSGATEGATPAPSRRRAGMNLPRPCPPHGKPGPRRHDMRQASNQHGAPAPPEDAIAGNPSPRKGLGQSGGRSPRPIVGQSIIGGHVWNQVSGAWLRLSLFQGMRKEA